MRRPSFGVVLLVACCAGGIGGCGGSDESDTTVPSDATTTAAATVTDEAPPGGDPAAGPTEPGDDEHAHGSSSDDPVVVRTPRKLDVVVDEFRLSGDAKVFEGALVWRLETNDGSAVLQRGTLTASCGAPCRGTFDETIKLAPAVKPGNYGLYVGETDPSDGEGKEPFETYTPLTVHAY